jgi:hypothetical protein
MRTITKMGLTLCMAGAFCYAENWNGKLIDASCYDNSRAGSTASTNSGRTSSKLDKECAPTSSTSTFAIQTSGSKVYKLDSAGNAKAAEAMQAGSLKSDKDGDVHVSISGSMQGDTVKVDSLQGKGGEHR